jgi:hypothetical protein
LCSVITADSGPYITELLCKIKTELVENRATAREANQNSVVLRYIQFMLAQQQYARLREADAREALQESDNSIDRLVVRYGR